MDKIEIINAIYHEYFLNDIVASESFDFPLDADRIYVIRNINKFDNLSKQEIIENVRKRFFSFINSDDPNVVDKQILHITQPLYISIQRAIIPSLPKYKYFPININCIDLQCMLLEIRFGGKGDKNFQKYLMNRFEMINSQKNLKFDVDEIDVYGYFIDENESNIRTLNMLKEYANIENQIDLMISNGIYREKINKELSEMFFENRIIDFTEETISDYIIRIFTKNN